MVKQLRPDPHFIPLPVNAGDEIYQNGIFEFNITQMIKYINENITNITLEEVTINNFIFSSIDELHLQSVDITLPVILAEISPGKYNIIDGNHRMEKARRLGSKSILAYKINAQLHINFLTSQKAYITYIDYWNSKIKEQSDA